MSSPKISVIVPVYKVEQYLPKCIESILAQTFTDFEVLLIDDGSPDKSGEICDKYAEKDCRVRVFHKENGGVSSARNIGLENAIGEFVTFCDSDDWVLPKWLESFHIYMNNDISIQGFTAYNWDTRDNKVEICCNLLSNNSANLSDLYTQLYSKLNIGFLWCRLFKRKLIEDLQLRFDANIHLREDELFIHQFMKGIKTFSVIPTALYQYYLPDWRKYSNISPIEHVYSDRKILNAVIGLDLMCNQGYIDSQRHRLVLSLGVYVLKGNGSIKEKFLMLKECRILLKEISDKKILTKFSKTLCFFLCVKV